MKTHSQREARMTAKGRLPLFDQGPANGRNRRETMRSRPRHWAARWGGLRPLHLHPDL